jgi:hypothetical protein
MHYSITWLLTEFCNDGSKLIRKFYEDVILQCLSTSHPGGVVLTAQCYRNQDRVRPDKMIIHVHLLYQCCYLAVKSFKWAWATK